MPTNTMTPGDELDLDHHHETEVDGPVECLGKTFENDQARREYYLDLLDEKLKDPEFRKIEGFPIGEDEDILKLSDPPYFTACPNPFIKDFINFYGRTYDSAESYKREPYAADVSEGKNHPVYMAHSYHTKVPHRAIMRYLLHYTEPGDLVLDGFCGSGMTGVAAALCGDITEVESLGYKVLADGSILQKTDDAEGRDSWEKISSLGARKAVLSDLAPAATFIAQNYNTPKSKHEFKSLATKILNDIQSEFGWAYETNHKKNSKGMINYVVWSDVYSCPQCGEEIVFWDEAVDREQAKVKAVFSCSNCRTEVSKKSVSKIWVSEFDKYKKNAVKKLKTVPVLINYSLGNQRFEKTPDNDDYALLERVGNIDSGVAVPTNEVIDGKEIGRLSSIGVNYVSQILPERSNIILSEFFRRTELFPKLRIIATAAMLNLSWMYRWRANGKGGITSGTYYICATPQENNAIKQLAAKLKDIDKAYIDSENCITTQDSSWFDIPSNSFDYLFFDPPFGANLMYSELSYLWESWLKVLTNNIPEAIENPAQNKDVDTYRKLMNACFREAYRILKPGRWMTVEFSNTKSSVWNSIQIALTEAGFIIANVSALDKKQGSFKAVTTATAVRQDLVISAYKPNGGFEERFERESDDEGVWDFMRTHLGYLPILKRQSSELVKIPERDPRILFDQLVTYFVKNIRALPISSKEFQQGLVERFAERDGMIFLPEQVVEYDKARITSKQLKQLVIFVDDEASAIEWLRQLLNEKPLSYQDIHPNFINELSGWKKAEEQLELSKLLEQNFLKYDGEGLLPPQVHSYLSTNFKEMRNLKKDDAQLIKKAKDRWYVPNPEREEDLQKLRERDLLKQFEEYKNHTGRKLKSVRLESVRCGFKKAWQDRDYVTIINIAEKIPQNLLQEDQKLLMWYDQAQTRHSDESLF
jgi:DNA modification methylase